MKLSPLLFGISASLGLVAAFGVLGCAKKFNPGGVCVAQTCEELAANCGSVIDACGNSLDCGVCLGGMACGAGGPNVCGLGTCTPIDCVATGSVGVVADGCGSLVDCGAGTGTGGAGTGGAATGGDVGTGGTVACDYGNQPILSNTKLGTGTQSGSGSTTDRYKTIDVSRSGKPYKIITNGWGPGFQSHNISYNGTSMSATLQGSRGSSGEPAGYPSVFCGRYSNPVIDAAGCGLPASTTASIKTGLRWTANGNTNNYNAAWDIWIGDGYNLQSYLMVWLHYPGGTATGNANNERPAGNIVFQCVEVAGLPGVWDISSGTVGGKPIINYYRRQGMDYTELEFDVKDLIADANSRVPDPGLAGRWKKLVGSQVNAVAVGFEIWNSTNGSGPLKIDDFYVE